MFSVAARSTFFFGGMIEFKLVGEMVECSVVEGFWRAE